MPLTNKRSGLMGSRPRQRRADHWAQTPFLIGCRKQLRKRTEFVGNRVSRSETHSLINKVRIGKAWDSEV